jgi:hypothetical protein
MQHDRYEGIRLDDLPIEYVDWQHRAEHIRSRSSRNLGDFDVDPEWGTEAVLDPLRMVRMTDGRAIAVVGFSPGAERVLKVWLVPKDLRYGEWWGASACEANRRDRRDYGEPRP